ncbi:major capsid protein [Arthrobacter phage Mufasa8]|uniref:Major capsid protein n=1 Tax=Arthrobacter phage Mufasa8 TaxID=2656526 RepID=A0A649VM25_9CAUD|nr:major capsid protein [Arthrobacter phage Mufasa8]QGJ93456.1 major capsid protein [Arthrobacter phage Mufasa8]
MTAALEQLSTETIEEIKKAQTTGVTVATGITGYDLSGLISLIPVNTPWFDRVSRVGGKGAQVAQWKALTNINNAQPNPFSGLEAGGGKVKFNELDVFAPYRPLRMAGEYTLDSRDLAQGYADTKAIAVAGTLGQWRIGANKAHLGGQAFALPAISSAVLTASGTGGTIGASANVFVRVAARSPYNFYWGGSGAAAAAANVTVSAGTTNSVTATVASVRGAVAYDWFVGSSAGTEKYLTTTTVNKLVITSIPGANQPAPTNIPSLSATAPTAVPTVDASYNQQNSFNGLFATLSGDYGTSGLVSAGSGVDSGATFRSIDGAQLTTSGQGVKELDDLLLDLFNRTNLSPSAFIMNGQQAKDIASRITASGAASTYLQPDSGGRVGMTGGASVARYINSAAGGQSVEIVVDPHFPVGQIVAVTEHINYPNSGITNTFESRTLRDVSQWDYGVAHVEGAGGGPKETWDVSSIETFVNRAPVACGVISNIAAG